jgi:hypothetical protein
MRHSFYALMGGFAFQKSVMGQKSSSFDRSAFLSTTGIQLLTQIDSGLIPDISTEHIWAESKSGAFGKLFICLQALWYCIQCLSRLAKDMNISLLELNAFNHAFCTIVVYIMWWDKPYEIENSTLIQGEAGLEI